jgi:hypothetical protein
MQVLARDRYKIVAARMTAFRAGCVRTRLA